MRTVTLSFTLSLLLLFLNRAEAQTQAWKYSEPTTRTFRYMTVDASGNTYVTEQHSDTALLVKIDTAGHKLWQVFYKGSNINAKNATVDTQGNVYYCGNFTSSTTATDGFLIKVNSLGTLQWTQTYDYQGTYDGFENVAIDKDNNVIVTGTSVTNGGVQQLLVMKYLPTGNVAWVQRIGQSGYYYNGLEIINDATGNILISAARMTSGNGFDAAVVKLNTSGTVVWEQVVNVGLGFSESPSQMSMDAVGNLYQVGTADSSSAVARAFIIKYGSDGSVSWLKTSNNATGAISFGTCIVGADGNLYLGGYDSTSAGYFAKIDASTGNTIWTANTGLAQGTIYKVDFAHNALYATGYVQGLGTNYDVITLKLNTDGTEAWRTLYNGLDNDRDYGQTLKIVGSDILVGAATSESNSLYETAGVIKYHETLTGIFEMSTDAPFTVTAYPNPTARELLFTIDMAAVGNATMSIYDLNGKQIATIFNQQMETGKTTVQWNAERLSKGTYLYEMYTPIGKSTGKFIKF